MKRFLLTLRLCIYFVFTLKDEIEGLTKNLHISFVNKHGSPHGIKDLTASENVFILVLWEDAACTIMANMNANKVELTRVPGACSFCQFVTLRWF